MVERLMGLVAMGLVLTALTTAGLFGGTTVDEGVGLGVGR